MLIQEAGPMNLLRTIFILILIYYGVKFLARLFAPFLMKKMMHKMQEKASQFNNQQSQADVKEGETIIDKKPQSNKQSNDSVGEYVDFEEVE